MLAGIGEGGVSGCLITSVRAEHIRFNPVEVSKYNRIQKIRKPDRTTFLVSTQYVDLSHNFLLTAYIVRQYIIRNCASHHVRIYAS